MAKAAREHSSGRGVKGLLDRRSLRRMAGARSFERGEDYFDSGQVHALAEFEGTIAARVSGTRDYRVKLWVGAGGLEFSCTCPVGTDGAFCKHCVAVGLAWLAQGSEAGARSRKRVKSSVSMKDVRGYLAGQGQDTLVAMLMAQAMGDERLRRGLLLKAAKHGRKGLDVNSYLAAIDTAVDTGEFIEYGAAHDYSAGIEDVVRSIEELLTEGHAAEVIEITEHALAAVENAMESVDDSDGHLGGVLERIEELHHAACKKAKPDPESLAERLFEWELRTPWDTFFGAVERYADVLGKQGLEAYRVLAEAEWARVPTCGPGGDDTGTHARRFRITHIMETLARQSGDVEAVVAIKRRDLSHAYAYLEIAETYREAREHDLALEWAERGVKAFPERTDPRLREFLAEEYHRRKRYAEAMELVWSEFTDLADLSQYQNLKRHAGRCRQWPVWREKALDHLRGRIAQAKRESEGRRWGWAAPSDHTELVRVFLWEKDVEAAWREAREGGCSDDLWLQLAAKREPGHPEDVLPVYQRQVEATVARKNNEAYAAAIGYVRAVRRVLVRLKREAEFPRYLESVRAAHKPKRNFIKLLDAERAPATARTAGPVPSKR
jgi:uncharacterized Zn finger protein